MKQRGGLGLRIVMLLIGVASGIVPLRVGLGTEITLKNGMILSGRVGKITRLFENFKSPPSSAVGNQLIVLIDDDLRRTFVSTYQVQQVGESEPGGLEIIRLRQRVAKGGSRVAGIGGIRHIGPFDEWGRREFSINTLGGPLRVLQGITEISPHYAKVEGLRSKPSLVWDMRIATSSIPRETLSTILMNAIDPKSVDDRLRIMRLYLQAERYEDARAELERALKEFPAPKELQDQVRALRQLSARRRINEIQLRRDAGQHRLAYQMLSSFPADDVAGETLLRVRQMLDENGQMKTRGERVITLLKEHLSQVEDENLRQRIGPIYDEIVANLNVNSLDRMADYLRLADDKKMDAPQKISLAISGWLLGSGSGAETLNLAVALSLVEVRELVVEYLRATSQEARTEILDRLASLEGSTPRHVAKLLAHMRPPIETASQQHGDIPGLYELSAPGLRDEPDVSYFLQLPPEYDPSRRYPAVVTLNGANTTPLEQINWWAGQYSREKKTRLGQATRRGYVVIAPKWASDGQSEYRYSAREHAAVLSSLRDACRRVAIDTDRVFLSGHSMGGDAVWDIGLAHPDLWAGVVPIVAVADRYVGRYWENARNVPFYFVAGELDGKKMSRNSIELDRYLRKSGFDTMFVQYLGRGHEHFHDEIQRLFEWMELHERNFFPREFRAMSMRPWDNFFWWLELDEFPSRSMVVPVSWPQKGARAVATEGKILPNNRVSITTAAAQTTVWLSPEMVDFDSRIAIAVRGRKTIYPPIAPSLQDMLEDVRTRGDRQHPFWVKTVLQTGRRR